jgi:hypothetical protein
MEVTVLFAISFLVSSAALFVALPRCVEIYHRFARGHLVECPESKRQSTVVVSPGIAAGSSAIAGPLLVVRGCALWPENRHCKRRCIAQLRRSIV